MNLQKSLSNLGVASAMTLYLGLAAPGCSGDSQPSSPGVGGALATGGQTNAVTGGASTANTGGSRAVGETGGATTGVVETGGMQATGGQAATGGKSGVGGTSAKITGGTAGVGGSKSIGGTDATGGSKSTGGTSAKNVGGTSSIGTKNSGGTTGVGGSQSDGGVTATGGSKAIGGTAAAGGSKNVGGTAAVGGTNNVGGSAPVGGTAAVGGTSATSTQSTGYCPTNEPCRISPLGDSITEGMGWTPPGASTWGGGYRVKLFSLGNADAKSFTFVGTRSNGPNTVDGKSFPKNHEGTSGISIEDLQKNVVDAGKLTGSAVKPHIILLHIGTNNMYNSHPATPDVLMGSLLDKIIAACPNSLLVVAKIIPYPGNASGIQSFNDKLPALVQERANKGAHIVLVDQFTSFPTSELADGVHPNEAGYSRMAGVWYKAISQYLH